MPTHRPRSERALPRTTTAPILGLLVAMLAVVGLMLLIRSGSDPAEELAINVSAAAVVGADESAVAASIATTAPVPTVAATTAPIAATAPLPSPTATPIPTSTPPPAPTSTPPPLPTAVPTALPTTAPAVAPTAIPTAVPAAPPTAIPTAAPTTLPTAAPTAVPTAAPTSIPTALPTTAPTSSPTAVPTSTAVQVQPAQSLAQLEAWVLNEVNGVRANAGLAPMAPSSALASIARDWSAQMANNGGISHRPGAQLSAMMPTGWSAWAENVAQAPYGPGIGTIEGGVAWAQNALVQSPGHYGHMVGNYNTLGVGIHVQGDYVWVTQNFGNY